MEIGTGHKIGYDSHRPTRSGTSSKSKSICHQSASDLSNRASTLSKIGCSPEARFAFTPLIASLNSKYIHFVRNVQGAEKFTNKMWLGI